MWKINMFEMDEQTFWSQLLSCYALYIVHNCKLNHNIAWLDNFRLSKLLNPKSQKKSYALNGHTDFLVGIDYRELKGLNCLRNLKE